MKFGPGLLVGAALAAVWPGVALAAQPIPFTTFATERDAALERLQCAWASAGGVEATFRGPRYSFLCKGGTWATVNYFLDEGAGGSLTGARLVFRQWDAAVHPAGGEAYVAQKYLTHVVNQLIPASLGPDVQSAFWGNRARSWRGTGVNVEFSTEAGDGFVLRRLSVVGNGRAAAQPTPQAAAAAPVPLVPRQTRQTLVEWDAPAVSPTAPVVPARPALATSPSALGTAVGVPWLAPGLSTSPTLAPVQNISGGLAKPPAAPARPVVAPGVLESLIPTMPKLGLSLGATAPSPTLPVATPADLKTAPEPESQQPDVAPPPVSPTLVPTPRVAPGRAPSNFDVYNRATDLTREFEQRALTKPGANPLVQPGRPGVSPSAPPATSPTAVPNTAVPPLQPATTSPSVPAPAPAAAPPPGPAPEPRFDPGRALPQLKFIPKAKPQTPANQVIEFEDERSRL